MPPRIQAAGAGCLVRAIRAYVVFVVGCVTASVILGYAGAAYRVGRAEAAWATKTESMEAFAARYPAEPDSGAAETLDGLTRPLGIRMIWHHGKESADWKGANDDLLKRIGTFIGEREHSGTDELVPIPAEAQRLLAQEQTRLSAIEAHIISGGPLRWEQDISKGVAAPMASLLAQRQLQSVLLARAWQAAGRRRGDEVERALLASWTLNASLLDRPDLLSRLIAVAVAEMEHGVLRAARVAPEQWLPRLHAQLFTRDVRIPYQLEAWNWTRFTKGYWGIFDVSYMENGATPPVSLLGGAGRVLTTPYVRLSLADMSERLLQATQELAARRRCDFDVDRYAKEFEESFPNWNILGRLATPAVIRGWTSLRYADLDRELTERVLLARARRDRSEPWPTEPVASAVCEGVTWLQEGASDGSLRVRASERPFAADTPNWSWAVRLRP